MLRNNQGHAAPSLEVKSRQKIISLDRDLGATIQTTTATGGGRVALKNTLVEEIEARSALQRNFYQP